MKVPTPLWLAVALLAHPALVRGQAGSPLAFTNASVIDVEAGRTLPGMTVVVSGGRITAVAPGVPIPAGARVIDAKGKYLMPGLWDMHVHAAFAGLADLFFPVLLANGITGVREMFSRLDWVQASRSRIARGELPGPRIVASGHILDGVPPIWPGSVAVGTAAQARRAVDSLLDAGADFIKVYSRLSREAYFAAAAEARSRRKPFAGHVPSLVRAWEAADSGQRSIEHLTGVLLGCETMEDQSLADVAAAVAAKGWDSATTVSRARAEQWLASYRPEKCRTLARHFVAKGTWMVPTLAVLHSTAYLDDTSLARDPRLAYIPQAMRQGWNPAEDFRFRTMTAADWRHRKAIYAQQLEVVRLLHQEGVQFLAGTDLANPYVYPGFSLHDELVSLVAAGFTPAEALRAATLGPALYLEATDSLGTVAAGKVADLVLLSANPLEDIRNTTKIEAVVAAGRLYDAPGLAKLLAEARARAR